MHRGMPLLLCLFLCAEAHATLWDFTLSSTAITSSGVYGRETATYRYDPANITVVSCTPTLTTPCVVPDWWTFPISDTWIHGAPYTISFGPILSVTYRGIVDGESGPGVMNSFDDDGFGCTKNIGGTRFLEECDGLQSFKQPVASSFHQILPVFWPSGGEDGFTWTRAHNALTDGGVIRSFARVELAEPGYLGILVMPLVLAAASVKRRTR